MTYDTMNPVPSADPRDLDDNAQAFDRFLQSTSATEPDRLGAPRKTWYQMEQDALALISPNVAALAGLTLSADKGLYATGAGALATYDLSSLGRTLGGIANAAAGRTALSAAASGDNTDITSIAGSAASLTTLCSISVTGDATWTVSFNGTANVSAAITLANTGVSAGTYGSVTVNAKGLVTSASTITPIANGGTGATSMGAGAVGTVSQAAGVPTGAVLETVSNANGVCTKYADGTMICESTNSTPVTTSNAIGGIFSANTVAFTFPVPFVGADPVVSPALSDVTVAASWAGCGGAVTLTSVGIAIFS